MNWLLLGQTPPVIQSAVSAVGSAPLGVRRLLFYSSLNLVSVMRSDQVVTHAARTYTLLRPYCSSSLFQGPKKTWSGGLTDNSLGLSHDFKGGREGGGEGHV